MNPSCWLNLRKTYWRLLRYDWLEFFDDAMKPKLGFLVFFWFWNPMFTSGNNENGTNVKSLDMNFLCYDYFDLKYVSVGIYFRYWVFSCIYWTWILFIYVDELRISSSYLSQRLRWQILTLIFCWRLQCSHLHTNNLIVSHFCYTWPVNY